MENFNKYFLDVIKHKYALFDGRAARREFWMFALFNLVIGILIGIAEGILHIPPFLGMLYSLALLVPSIGLGIRRLHDTSRSGWWMLIGLIPFIGAIVLIIFAVMESTPGTNAYGPNPYGDTMSSTPPTSVPPTTPVV